MARRSKAWCGAELARGEVTYRFSPAAQEEIVAYLSRSGQALPGAFGVDLTSLAAIRPEIEELRRRVEQVHGFAMVEPPAALEAQRRALASLIGRLLGESIEQNREGIKVIQVNDRDRTRRIEDGARYHQTRQGGSSHTDNVNRPKTWDYLMMACLSPAMLGGESIVVSGLTVHNFLRGRAPRVLDVLPEDFWWECRSFSDDFFRAPVLFFNHLGEPQFRYLREYLESVHQRQGAPLRGEQLWALDSLDSVLELSELQFRCRLAPGEILIIDDLQMFHGHTRSATFSMLCRTKMLPRRSAGCGVVSIDCGSARVPLEIRLAPRLVPITRHGTSVWRAWRCGHWSERESPLTRSRHSAWRSAGSRLGCTPRAALPSMSEQPASCSLSGWIMPTVSWPGWTGLTSPFGHYYDLAVGGVVLIALFIGIGIGLRNDGLGERSVALGVSAGLAIAVIFLLRIELERRAGKDATQLSNLLGFEIEDVMYLVGPITWLGLVRPLLVLAGIGAPVFALFVSLLLEQRS